MITVDREKARQYVNEILDDCDEPYCSVLTEDELDVFISLIDEPSEQATESFFEWLDDARGGQS